MGLQSQILQKLNAITQWMNNVIANSKENHEFEFMDPVNRNALIRAAVSSQSYKISIQGLFDELVEDLVVGNVPLRFISVSIDHEAAGSEISKMVAAINSGPDIFLEQGFAYHFYNSRSVLTNGTGLGTTSGDLSFAMVRNHFAFKKKMDPDGNGNIQLGASGVQLTTSDFYPSYTLDTRDLTPIEIDLGDIGTDEVWQAINTSGPYSTPNSATVVFEAVQDSESKKWFYIGDAEEIGDGEYQTQESDFVELTGDSVTDPPPYQETLPTSSSALLENQFQLNNHEGGLRFMNAGNTIIDVFVPVGTISDFKLNAFYRFLISTTGRKEFPKVQGTWDFALTGTSGSANLSIGEDSFTINYDTDLDTTATNFVSTESENILAANGFVLTSPSAENIKLVGATLGTVSIENANGDLSASRLDETIEAVNIFGSDFEADQEFDMFVEWDGYRINYLFIKR